MGYDIFHFGLPYVAGHAQRIPEQNENIPQYDEVSVISFGPSLDGKSITWIKPNGMNIFVADRVLLSNVSWDDLKKNSFVRGKRVIMDGQRFRCRLLRFGVEEEESPDEWGNILAETDMNESIWHWDKAYFWETDILPEGATTGAIRGLTSALFWEDRRSSRREVDTGFRPVLEPLGDINSTPNYKLDGVEFRLSKIPGSDGHSFVLQPTPGNVFADIPNGQQVKMYTLLKDGKPVRMDTNRKSKYNSKSRLKLTDRYYGDEYLISWTISDGIAVTAKTLTYR